MPRRRSGPNASQIESERRKQIVHHSSRCQSCLRESKYQVTPYSQLSVMSALDVKKQIELGGNSLRGCGGLVIRSRLRYRRIAGSSFEFGGSSMDYVESAIGDLKSFLCVATCKKFGE
ncbi:hypothetical protein AVEN_144607-1 [Araneus ventricosus]|uniref:Uncharacterized protein n=1 Tax=Araneus ventricosus TaxID=182803 RepID=A0A4Y2C0A5_ARAVE|nr:hypothetical protein AVEN_144607-1 [Araneus ventricosus]